MCERLHFLSPAGQQQICRPAECDEPEVQAARVLASVCGPDIVQKPASIEEPVEGIAVIGGIS
jgi:hypothetical protein